MSEVERPLPAAGWYPDPTSGHQRWWDGSAWQQFAPAPQQVVVAPRLPANGLAIASLVIGISGFVLSLTIIGLFVAIPAAAFGLLFGFIGLSEAKRRGGRGRAQAWWGIVLCGLPFAVWVWALVVNAFSGN